MCMWLKHKRECYEPYSLDNDCILGLGLNCNVFDQEEEQWQGRGYNPIPFFGWLNLETDIVTSWTYCCHGLRQNNKNSRNDSSPHLWESRWMCIPAWWFCKFVTLCWKVSPGSVAEVSGGAAGGDRALHESNSIKLHKLVQITQDTFQLFLLLFI